MRIHKTYIMLGLVLAFGLFFELMAHASDMNEATKLTFSQPVQIPGQILPAGTYTFQQAAPNDDLNLVQIFNADGSVVASLQTVPVERMKATGKTTLTLAEPESGKPDLLVKWFYPGRLTGHEFVYPNQQEQQIAQASQVTFVGSHLTSNPAAAGE